MLSIMNLLVQLDQVPSLTSIVNPDISPRMNDQTVERVHAFIYGRPHFASPLLLYGLMAGGDLKAMTLYRDSIVTPLLPQGFPTTSDRLLSKSLQRSIA